MVKTTAQSNPGRIVVHAEIDLNPFLVTIAEADKLDGKVLFDHLAMIAKLKKELEFAQERFEIIERDAKRAINDKAKAIYGPEWGAIKGDGYKISRSFSGSVYDISMPGEVDDEFLSVKIAPNTDAIDKFVETKNTLPNGIERNPNRTEQIRITVNGDVDDNG